MKFYINLYLFVRAGKEAVFQEYEIKVLPLLAKYNGKLMYRLKPKKESFVELHIEAPYEIHLVMFNSKTDFERYKMDEERISYAHLFQQSVHQVLLFESWQ